MPRDRIRIHGERREQVDTTKLCAALVAMARLKQSRIAGGRPTGVGDGD